MKSRALPKLLLRLIITLAAGLGSADTSAQTRITDSIPGSGILLDTGWKFEPGDNAEYAKPNFEDGTWQPAVLSHYASYLTPLIKSNIGWFRLHLFIDTSVQKQQLAVQLSQLGASEMYLNGHLFQKSGSVQSGGDQTSFNPNNKPYLLPGNDKDSIVIAIRFSTRFPAKQWLFTTSSSPKPPLALKINSWSKAMASYEADHNRVADQTQFSYLFVALSFLFFLLYLFFPSEKINLLFAGVCLFAVIRTYLVYQLSWGSFEIRSFAYLSYLLDLNDAILGILSISLVCYGVFKTVPFYYRILISGISLDLLLIFLAGPTRFQFLFDFLFHALTVVGFFYLSISAVKKRIYTLGLVAFISGMLNLTFFVFFFHIDLANLNSVPINDYIRYSLTVNFIVMTIYVALNFARKSKYLQIQLIENEKLSQDKLKNEREKQQILASQNETLETVVSLRTAELTKSIDDLKAAQAQIIQSEKMASLGELTAGIAHEIQNPLNFVNNFSDLKRELLQELDEAAAIGNLADVKEIAGNVLDNELKINHHGKRAESIVKGMLQHSRQTKGVKTPTDVNALCDEYLRLSFFGLRAKNNGFKAEFETDFEHDIPFLNVVSQDIGRVLLNLFNNAFYAVMEKAKLLPESYKPKILVKTRKHNEKIEISVTDNGNGIPKAIVDKIFQPFFTTKPPGEGTGLGLSMAYDIVNKLHNGRIEAESEEGRGAVFTIQLPVA